MNDDRLDPRDLDRGDTPGQRARRYGDPDVERDARTGKGAAAARMAHKQGWVDQQLRIAMERGDFDDLPGAGKPIQGLGASHDPDWWVKKLVEREQIAVLPPSLALRKEDAELDDLLDKHLVESDVRRDVTDFNERVIRARYALTPGPPLITMPRDVEETVEAWRERRRARREASAAAVRAAREQEPPRPRGWRRWWRGSRA